MIDGGNVLLNGKVVKAGEKLRLNGVVQAEKPVLQEVKTKPEDIPIEIVYEDDDLAVVSKPQGMVVHAGAGNPRRPGSVPGPGRQLIFFEVGMAIIPAAAPSAAKRPRPV